MTQKAIVVGAGIGGLSTAIGLRNAGWSVTVLERWPEVVGVGAALGVWPEAGEGLRRLGVGDGFDHESVSVAAAGVFRADGRALVRVREGSRRIPPVRLISRRRLMDLLVRAADGIDVRTDVRADSAQLRDALAHADVLIGADGLRSDVRRTFFDAPTVPRYSGMVGWRGSVAGEIGDYGETWGHGALFGHTPMEPGRTNFYAAVPAPEDEPGTFAAVRRQLAGWREPIPTILAAAEPGDILCNPIYDLDPPLASFITDRVALLGDAAHAMTPNLGRGACEAIIDAAALVEELTTAEISVALPAYDARRRKPAQRVAARSWSAMKLARWRRLAPLRDTLVGAAGRFVR